MLVFFILPAILLIPIGLYFFIFLKRLFQMFIKDKRVYLLLSIVISLVLMYLSWPIFRTNGMIIGHFFAFCLIVEIINYIYHKKAKKVSQVWEFGYKTGLISLITVALFMSYGFYNMQHVYQKDYQIKTSKIKDLKIGVISDLHFGVNMDIDDLNGYLQKIENNKIDMFLLVGDIFDESTTKENMEKASQLLGNVKSQYGTYYVLGNHDPNLYVDKSNYSKEYMCRTLEKNKVHVLEDEIIELADFTLIGRKDASDHSRKNIYELMKDVDLNRFVLLMDHQPLGLKDNASAKIDLQISGHTHAGQIWPTGYLMEMLGANEMNYGYRQMNDMQVIVTSGIAGWGYPIRTGGHCEYVIIEISGE